MSNFQVAYFKNEKIYNRNIPSEVNVYLIFHSNKSILER